MSLNASADEPQPLNLKDSDSLSMFVRDIQKFPYLKADDEYHLATRWQQENDPKAMEKLVQSHLRLVFKVAQGYRGYGLPLHDLVAEGNIGLMQALRKFDVSKGFRFSTYALWWIRAALQEYILKNWSLVKIGTTTTQKKLFFNLKKVRSEFDDGQSNLSQQTIQQMADKLEVNPKDVEDMMQRLQSHDSSLNTTLADGNEGEWQDLLESKDDNQETSYANRQEFTRQQMIMQRSMACLDQREHTVLSHRRLLEPPKTLDEIAQQLDLSKERVRQIEVSAFHKLQTEARKHFMH